MGIMDLLDLLTGKRKNNNEEYSEERVAGLKIAKSMANKRQDYFKQKKQFESQQKEMARQERFSNQRSIPLLGGMLKAADKFRQYNTSYKQQIQQGKVPRQTRMRIAVLRKSARLVYPQLPAIISSDSGRGRGRPKGSVKYPGGIYQWRKMQRLAKKAATYQTMLRRNQAIQNYPQMAAQRAYNQQVQQMQVPQEMQGSAYPQQNVAQYPQQYPEQTIYPPQQVQPQQREIRTPFKSSGGSPYPPVAPSTLQQANLNPGWVQYADSFTGEIKWKRLPQAEAWISS